MESKEKRIALTLAVGFVFLMTAQTAFATNATMAASVYKYWLTYPHKAICDDIHCNHHGQWWFWVSEYSNDPSYQYGFNTAKTNYQNVFSIPQTDFSRDYQVTNNDAVAICHDKTVADPDTCIHGYVQGFREWCRTNAKECVGAAIGGSIPIQLMTFGGYDNGWPQPSVLKPVVGGYNDTLTTR